MRFIAVFSAVLFFSLFATNTEVLGIATYTVNTTADTAPNGCTGAAGGCTLREAIIAANATAGPDQINFNIPGAGVREIVLLSELPFITEAVTIDGLTQPLATCDPTRNLLISITGPLPTGFILEGANSTIRGLAITTFQTQVTLAGTGGHKIECSNIGVDPAANSQATVPNGGVAAIAVFSGGNTIGGTDLANIISSPGGIRAFGASGLTIKDNLLGINTISQPLAEDGDVSISLLGPNNNIVIQDNSFSSHFYGIVLGSNDGPDDSVSITGNSFLSRTPAAITVENHDGENLSITGNDFIGDDEMPIAAVRLSGSHQSTTVRGNNFLGSYIGVYLADAWGVSIGGPDPADGNVFNGAYTAAWATYSGNPIGEDAVTIQNNLITGEATPSAEWTYRAGIVLTSFEPTEANLLIANNTIVGQSYAGIAVSEVRGVVIQQNYIGVHPDGTAGANTIGILATVSGTQGPLAIGPGNIISANLAAGIQLLDSKNVMVAGNTIGPGPSNERYFSQPAGVSILGGSGHLVVNNPSISGNLGPGIVAVDSTGFVFQGNTITGNSGPGIISSSQAGAVSGAMAGNQLVGNGGPGVLLSGDQSVVVDLNSFEGNLGPAIDLGGDGVDVNDNLDADTGPNGRLNAPVLDWVQSAAGTLTVTGSLDTAPNTTGYIDFYLSDTCGASGTGQGAYTTNTAVFQTDANGHYTIQFSTNSGLTPGKYLSGVFRDSNSLGAGTSSEFSNCRLVVSDSAPTLTALSTNSAVLGSGEFLMYVTGANFTPDSVAYFGVSPRTTEVLDEHTLRFLVDGFDLVTVGPARITVLNPAVSEPEPRGAEGSNPLRFEVTVSPRADVNCSGYVSADDALQLMWYIAGEMTDLCTFDPDGDSETGLADVLYIRKVAAGILPE